ncbi:hypothetical protein N7495_000126 [Penicillium taxi]|uniref:uncharacterized protein n=1 Tax=Penicillium taxi TaxID=168475 RepID=UPI002544FF68|nr:uncharacterized protein N7495_000126 [Penicillium taxi]KAJ5907444.1 hypothetical protein N7495_000126 [Penicillium taxi]
MFNFNLFKSSSSQEAEPTQAVGWNSNAFSMQQPSSPAAPSTNKNVVDEQPSGQEQMQLRGGGGGGLCCGLCAGLACFECCEICC